MHQKSMGRGEGIIVGLVDCTNDCLLNSILGGGIIVGQVDCTNDC